ncbi:hypothetical protein [Chryseolinea soli]|uniref:DUF1080 domain-containing protein n=1 Tax=Chryseolinea soli TaxID=2321403 RepID=A0A385SJT5_9BACT|nr:hypothetical protein [Chryseolinea soli]AYB29650.1 hypothetical protein D4L85_03200 [Chryseolinea soli]
MNAKFSILLLILTLSLTGNAQSTKTYDLQKLLKEKQLTLIPPKPYPITDGDKKGVTLAGVAWLNGVDFSTGTIEVDLRGLDVLQRSFLGIAFHAVDSNTYDIVYFRPFNFQHPDPIRKIHAVQYMAMPDFPWNKLRDEHNGVYEKGIDPAPKATDWFHAKIEVTEDEIRVYVNNAATPSLKVKKLNTRKSGKIGLWNDALEGDFANLTIRTP